MIVEDLDLLRPESKFIKIGGKEIDVSFLPCAITFDIDQIMQELSKFSEDEIKKDPIKTKEAFELSVKLCAIFCQHLYPELDYNYFMNNCAVNQIDRFSKSIRGALQKAYNGVDKKSKNLKAPKKNL